MCRNRGRIVRFAACLSRSLAAGGALAQADQKLTIDIPVN
jgi:hypothetical protein